MGALGFTAPWLLLGLVALPLLWWFLRAVPPAPVRQKFPAVVLLFGLKDQQIEAQKTPWWLILIRLLAAAGLIIGFAGPVLSPEDTSERARQSDKPLIVLIDSYWPAASDWSIRVEEVDNLLQQAQQGGRVVAIQQAHFKEAAQLAPASIWRERLAAMSPVAWDAPYDLGVLQHLPEGESIWLSDGVKRDGRRELYALREAVGEVAIWQPDRIVFGLTPPVLEGQDVELRALRHRAGPAQDMVVAGYGRDPAGQLRALVEEPAEFAIGTTEKDIVLNLPPELRHRVQWLELAIGGQARSAGQVALVGESLTRRRVALVGAGESETLALLSPDHFLRAALAPSTEIVEARGIGDAVRASPHVVVMPDVPDISEPDQRALAKWVAEGGLLLRFAGPRLAAAQADQAGIVDAVEDILLPVRLRGRGRAVGGAMSWGAPQLLAPFPTDGPFSGLEIPEEVSVVRQVLAEPGPELAERTLARLVDGTPLVTRKLLGSGQVVLVHVGANAEWSNLVLSGLFVEMLLRLTEATLATPSIDPENGLQTEDTGVVSAPWLRDAQLSAQGALVRETSPLSTPLNALADAVNGQPSADAPPGIYSNGTRQLVINSLHIGATLSPTNWPRQVVPVWQDKPTVRDLSGWVLGAALALVLLDIAGTLWISGRLRSGQAARAGFVIVALGLAAPEAGVAQVADGQNEDAADQSVSPSVPDQVMAAAAEVTLAHVLTGDPELDALARAGLTGLSLSLSRRSSVEPAPPVGVALEQDDLSVFPLLYWPVSATQPLPSSQAYERLATYLATGGLILFDTRDAGAGGGNSAESRKLQLLAAPLSLPPLDPIPSDHVLTRAFYLIDTFPGRYNGTAWAEAAPPGAAAAEGVPFRLLNDGVTPVIIGGNDWAGAWAVREDGRPMLPVGRGNAGERQRELSLRFGVNLVMHVLTGNYKSDQVHVPALLQRLGQ
ncbi:DUF4159 domain-containing protein [Aliiroseovarius sp. KMU-50]|uniref:DUF4159 domain-containing protein n=1 Tax=Aliiroseovarius salicola TaxID=3009082 RepID=A0ABT4VZ84_9RHOB|nr:DUF4159 domain-containing protein [Aliiroseovarius sp. KMU-50]MDA5093568.1 DUF4159 domain-containing protein [Aliiroseovarius sp. KMU-50]